MTPDERRPHATEYAALFFLACGTLLFELGALRIFAVILWSNYAFLVVSTALFGFGLSGVVLAVREASWGCSEETFLLLGPIPEPGLRDEQRPRARTFRRQQVSEDAGIDPIRLHDTEVLVRGEVDEQA